MNEEKEKIPAKKITGSNTPNDDEEVLKNSDEGLENKIKDDKEDSQKNNNERSQGSETLGIP